MEVKVVEGVGILVGVIGIFMVVIGGILWFQKDTEYTWLGAVTTRPYEDTGHWLFNNGFLVIILGIAIFVVGLFLKWSKRRKWV